MNRHFILQFKISIAVYLSILFLAHYIQLEIHCSYIQEISIDRISCVFRASSIIMEAAVVVQL